MFEGTSNDGYYELGLQTAKVIQDAVALDRGMFTNEVGEEPEKGPTMEHESAPSEPLVDLG